MKNNPFGRWPANFKFAYVLSVIGLIAGVAAAVAAVVSDWGSGEDYVMIGLLIIVCAVVVVVGPRWVGETSEEQGSQRD